MVKQPLRNPADYTESLYMNGLHGRMLRLKSKPRKNKEILLVYGQHSSLERVFSLAEALNKYGGVTVPDLPGFGGMQSFYKIKEKPTIDDFADYLAAFVKLRYKNRRVTIVGMAFGFAVVTRMLQRLPRFLPGKLLAKRCTGVLTANVKKKAMNIRIKAWDARRKATSNKKETVANNNTLIIVPLLTVTSTV